ncbi:hypothetical protein Q0812_01040 [Brevundimonas sp. 2R-24]|uniref:Uncharacterized protein n=1 Tax=Peiella sedimenti TaxID=3061083 RepID=A0ABT8SHG4_9CAUL|nr:hypothetical protein [Caulobacteraceae bacterium XZ-24]
MATTVTSTYRRVTDHFEPQDIDPQEQRRLRGQLEQIDYAAYVANREVMGQILRHADARGFQRMAVACAQARAQWINEALLMSDPGRPIRPDQAVRLSSLRQTYEELAEAYEGLRRAVERGYVPFKPEAKG